MKEEIKKAEKVEQKIVENPFAVRVAEFKQEVIEAIMGHNLPPCVIEPILANIYNQVAAAAEKQLEAELAAIKKEEG